MKTTQKDDPEAVAQAELAKTERAMKAAQIALDEATRQRAIALNHALSFRYIRDDELRAQAERDRQAALAKAQQEAKLEKARLFDQQIERFETEMLRHQESGSPGAVEALKVLIATTKQ